MNKYKIKLESETGYNETFECKTISDCMCIYKSIKEGFNRDFNIQKLEYSIFTNTVAEDSRLIKFS